MSVAPFFLFDAEIYKDLYLLSQVYTLPILASSGFHKNALCPLVQLLENELEIFAHERTFLLREAHGECLRSNARRCAFFIVAESVFASLNWQPTKVARIVRHSQVAMRPETILGKVRKRYLQKPSAFTELIAEGLRPWLEGCATFVFRELFQENGVRLAQNVLRHEAVSARCVCSVRVDGKPFTLAVLEGGGKRCVLLKHGGVPGAFAGDCFQDLAAVPTFCARPSFLHEWLQLTKVSRPFPKLLDSADIPLSNTFVPSRNMQVFDQAPTFDPSGMTLSEKTVQFSTPTHLRRVREIWNPSDESKEPPRRVSDEQKAGRQGNANHAESNIPAAPKIEKQDRPRVVESAPNTDMPVAPSPPPPPPHVKTGGQPNHNTEIPVAPPPPPPDATGSQPNTRRAVKKKKIPVSQGRNKPPKRGAPLSFMEALALQQKEFRERKGGKLKTSSEQQGPLDSPQAEIPTPRESGDPQLHRAPGGGGSSAHHKTAQSKVVDAELSVPPVPPLSSSGATNPPPLPPRGKKSVIGALVATDLETPSADLAPSEGKTSPKAQGPARRPAPRAGSRSGKRKIVPRPPSRNRSISCPQNRSLMFQLGKANLRPTSTSVSNDEGPPPTDMWARMKDKVVQRRDAIETSDVEEEECEFTDEDAPPPRPKVPPPPRHLKKQPRPPPQKL